jgi:hypothetical protein
VTTPTGEKAAGVRGFFRSAAEAWVRFWFTPADPTVLGLIRVCCGAVMLWVYLVSTPNLAALYGPDGWLDQGTADVMRREVPWVPPPEEWDRDPATPPPVQRPEITDPALIEAYAKRWEIDPRAALDQGQTIFSFWFHVTDPAAMAAAHALALLVMLLFTLGVGTRVTSVLAWVVSLSYIHRASNALFGMDTMLALLLLYLMIGPCGAALSLDRLLARRRARKAKREPRNAPEPSVSANLAIRLLQVHFCVIYLASGLSKLQGAAWWNATALWQTTANYEFAGAHAAWVTEFLRFLTRHRWLWEVSMSAGTLFTLALEIGLPFLIWLPRTRWLCFAGAVLLHLGIAVGMGLISFSLLMLCILLAFVPAPVLRELLGRGRRYASG